MKIDCIELFFVKIPLEDKKPGFFAEPKHFEPSWIPGFRQSEVRFYLLKLGTDSGHEGVAAITAMGLERSGLGAILGNYLMGINPLDIALVNQRIQEFSYIGMRNGWIDAAFWDLIGKIRGEPLWKVLGGSGGHVHPYLSTGATHGHAPGKIGDIGKRAVLWELACANTLLYAGADVLIMYHPDAARATKDTIFRLLDGRE